MRVPRLRNRLVYRIIVAMMGALFWEMAQKIWDTKRIISIWKPSSLLIDDLNLTSRCLLDLLVIVHHCSMKTAPLPQNINPGNGA